MKAAPERLSLNQATVRPLGADEVIAACARHGIRHVGLWREQVAEIGVERSARLVREAGIGVSSLCRGGFFPAAEGAARAARHDDNVRALDAAATLGAEVLVLVCGGMDGVPLDDAREMVAEGIAALAPHAADRGVKLGIEPLHPMFAADRSVVATLGEANELADGIVGGSSAGPASEAVGIVVDVYHVWWDVNVYREIARAGRRIVGFHVNDWIVPPPDMLLGRGMMGDGVIEVRRLRRAVDAVGYGGPIEVEIFNEALWRRPADEVVELTVERFREQVEEPTV